MTDEAGPVLYAADMRDCRALAGFDVGAIGVAFASALREAGATIVREVEYVYPGAGFTCVLVLRESHAVLHTWPESGTVNIDIFSCSGKLNSRDAVEQRRRLFGARDISVHEIPRADGHCRLQLQSGA